MKILRFFIFMVIITSLSLVYVFQQTEIIKLAYQTDRKSSLYQELSNENIILKYDLDTLNSLSHLGKTLVAKEAKFELPNGSQLATLELPYGLSGLRPLRQTKRKALTLSLFNLKSLWLSDIAEDLASRQAEAKTIK